MHLAKQAHGPAPTTNPLRPRSRTPHIAEVALEPGKKVTLTFTPTRKGTFEIACQLSTGGGGSHAKAGMVGTLVVK
jgi:uncharacterized cupredoxin-like copper-binding protein